MLYMVTTTIPLGGPSGFGIFESKELAFNAILDYLEKHYPNYTEFDKWDNTVTIWNDIDGYYDSFYIESCYPNTPLMI